MMPLPFPCACCVRQRPPGSPDGSCPCRGVAVRPAALTSKGLGAAWKRVTGNEPPTIGPESEDTLRNVIVWTVITSVVGALVSVGIARAQRRFFS